MRPVKVIIITVMLGIAFGFLPKNSSAHDASLGFYFGIPVPVIKVYHALPAPPPPPWAFYNNRSNHRHAYANRAKFRHHRDYNYRNKKHGYYKQEERQNRHDYNDGYRRNTKPRKR